MSELQNGAFNSEMSFKLRKHTPAVMDGQPTASTETTIKGAYVIVDNGYLNWPTTVPPIKESCNRSEIRFSRWLESLRKDVECTFGILKGRWRVLKSGIRVHNTEAVDNIWLTCCALHNLLLEVDGLSVGWQNGVPSHWELGSGQFDHDDVPEAIRRLLSPDSIRTYDQSSFGRNKSSSQTRTAAATIYEDAVHRGLLQGSAGETVTPVANVPVAVNDLQLPQFRAMLIENFYVLFHEQKVVWPKRLGSTSCPRPVHMMSR